MPARFWWVSDVGNNTAQDTVGRGPYILKGAALILGNVPILLSPSYFMDLQNISRTWSGRYHPRGYHLGLRAVALLSYCQQCYGFLTGPRLPLLPSPPIHFPTPQPNSSSRQSSQSDALSVSLLLSRYYPAPWPSSVGEKPEPLWNVPRTYLSELSSHSAPGTCHTCFHLRIFALAIFSA